MLTTINHSPADVLRWLLIALGLGTDPANGGEWQVYAGNEPGTPDQVITITDTAGTPQGRLHIDGEVIATFGFQVRVRSKDHPTGWLKADAIRNALAKSVDRTQVTVGGVAYLVPCVVRIGNVIPLGKESASKRSIFTLNAETHVRQLA